MRDKWDQYLIQVAFATRTCQQRATKETPFYLVYGRQARLLSELDIPCSITKEFKHQRKKFKKSWMKDILISLLDTKKKVNVSMKTEQQRQKKNDDSRHRGVSYVKVQQVLVKNPTRICRKGEKIAKRQLGPFIVSKDLGKGVYRLIGKKGKVTCRNLKQFYSQEEYPI